MDPLPIFEAQNPWRRGAPLSLDHYVARDLLSEVAKWLEAPDVLVLTGPRQAGKTTMMKKLIGDLIQEGTDPGQIFYFNLDSQALLDLFTSPADLHRFVSDRSIAGRRYLFIDEAQRIADAGLFIKTLCDLPEPFKYIVSGSSSLELRAHTKEHLTGRKKEFRATPFSFSEFLRARRSELPPLGGHDLPGLQQYDRLYGDTLRRELAEFLRWGGYPKVVLQQSEERKQMELIELYSSYVEKDIRNFAGIEDVTGFNKLVALLAHQIGNLVNRHELGTSLGLARQTVEKYLRTLEETFVIKLLTPHSRNPRKELVKMPKAFFWDTGLRNMATRNFSPLTARGDRGMLVENGLVAEFLKWRLWNWEAAFWRTQTKAEVDLLLVSGERLVPVEVKDRAYKIPRITRGYRNFLKTYRPKHGLIMTRDFIAEAEFEMCRIHFIPAPYFILQMPEFLEM